MCESVEVARILDVSGALLKRTYRQNSALANLSVMAKIRLPEKSEFKKSTAFQVNCMPDKRVSPSKMLSSQASKETDLADVINNVLNLHLTNNCDDDDASNEVVMKTFSYTCNIIPSDDESSAKSSGKVIKEAEKPIVEDTKNLLERGPIRSQLTSTCRAKPYVDSSAAAAGDANTDYDTGAKAILRDREYREKIDFCLDQLSDMGQDPGNPLSPTYSDLSAASAYSQSPQPQQQWSPGSRSAKTSASSSCFVPSITVSSTDSSPDAGPGTESSLLHMLTQGGLQAAYSIAAGLTPEYAGGASVACASDNWPDSPDSRASSRAQSPGSNTGGGPSFPNAPGSLSASPQVSPQHLRNLQRPSSSSSSSHSYCETPSPANYQNPLEQYLEEQLGDSMMNRLPVWRDNYESSDTLVNSADLQLVEEVIRCDMNVQQQKIQQQQQSQQCHQQHQSHRQHQHQQHHHEQKQQQQQASPTHPCAGSELLQVVPTARTFGSPNSYQSMTGSVQVIPSPPGASYPDIYDSATDDLTNTLLKFVGSDQAVVSHRKVEPRCNSASSQYGYTGGGIVNREVRRAVSESCLPNDQSSRSNFLSKSPQGQDPDTNHQQTYQPQCLNFGPSLNVPGLRYPAASGESMGRDAWSNYSEPPKAIGNPTLNSNFDQFQMPKTVTTNQESPVSKRLSNRSPPKGQRTISPWPLLNLPATSSASRLKQLTKPEEVDRAMKNLLKRSLRSLTACDEDGDTILMCLVGNARELEQKLAYLAPLVERLGTIDGALSMLNHQGEDALYLAAMNCPQKAFVAGYLAAAYLDKKIDIGNRLYGERGNTLIHALALRGDDYGEVLAELLSLTVKEKSVFDLTKRNFDGRTPLHMAVRGHCDPSGSSARTGAIGSVRLLLENGADATFRDAKDGNTALHMAVSLSCDPSLVKALLTGTGRDAVNVLNYNGNTPLHLAAANSTRTSLERQLEVCWLLIQAGARSNVANRENKTPLALAPADRKEALRRLFHRRL